MQFSKENLINFVDKFLDLNEDSLKLFAERVITPNIAEEYAQFELDENHRKYWEFENEDLLQNSDEGWLYFCSKFRRFKEFYNISYKDFTANKIKINKNYIKLQKKLFNFLLGIHISSVRMSGLKTEIDNIFNNLSSPSEKINFRVTSNGFDFIYLRCQEEGDVSREAMLKKHEFYLKEEIRKHFETIGAKKISNKNKIYLVFTKNPVDMLFCSTGKSWSSCLNFESGYTYWAGLPNAVINKNRGMFYITDKEQVPVFSDSVLSNEFPGTIDKMLARSWSLIINNYENNDVISLVKFYPNNSYLTLVTDFLNKNVKSKNLFVKAADGYSKYHLELLYNSVGASPFIYLDNCEVIKEKKDKWKFLTGQDYGSCFIHNGCLTKHSFYGGLPGGIFSLIKNNREIQERAGKYTICPHCGCLFEKTSDCYDDEDREICYDCYDKLFHECSICRKIVKKEEVQLFEGFGYNTYVCQSCIPRIKPCKICGKVTFLDEDETDPICPFCRIATAC